jgi:GNAT superfamily N-acetyltransferase
MTEYMELGYLLNPPGALSIGPETAVRKSPSVFRLDSSRPVSGRAHSYRYVSYRAGKAVSALQVIGTLGGTAKIEAVYTVPDYRRMGLAAELLTTARQDFKKVKHSFFRSKAGSAWKAKVGNPLAYVRVTEEGHRFESGVPVTFPFFRNTERAPHFGGRFQQDIEPAGRYMLLRNKLVTELPKTWMSGTVTFHKPLVLAFNTNPDGGYDDTSWKAQLTRAYGRTGRALSQAVLRDGYDGIVTVQLDSRGRPMHTKEIVDLSVLRTQRLKK